MLDQSVGTICGPIAAGSWLVDPHAGHITVAVKNMWGFFTVRGKFDLFEGALRVSESRVRGELIVHTDSFDTKNETSGKHPRADDFFDSEGRRSPATFTITGVATDLSGQMLFGDLKFGAASSHLEIPVQVNMRDPATAFIRAELALPRQDVGLHWNSAGAVKGDARLGIELQLVASV